MKQYYKLDTIFHKKSIIPIYYIKSVQEIPKANYNKKVIKK